MGKVRVGTGYLTDDEPCFRLSEIDEMCLLDGQWHRYQILFVMREGALAERRIDMGLSKNFSAPPMFIPGGAREDGKIYIEETVGRLREIANEIRKDSTHLGTAQEVKWRTGIS